MAMKIICVYDAYNLWVNYIREACPSDYTLVEASIGSGIPSGAYVFLRPDMNEKNLEREKEWFAQHVRRPDITLITDPIQVMLYEDKCAQAGLFSEYLPPTWVHTTKEAALTWIEQNQEWPIVSKAAVGASSQFVDILNRDAAKSQAIQAFGDGIPLVHENWDCQKGYVLFQRFLPGNDFTWRVNVIGNEVAVFKRFNYLHKPVAETGNTKPVSELTPEVEEVIAYAREVAQGIGTKWVALDILRDYVTGELYLLETSLGWPWPGVGDGAKFFPSERPWTDMFRLMFEQMDEGVWW
jgi:glutathione synthase/RimK-type ligase-like ATP-grasp enzyme